MSSPIAVSSRPGLGIQFSHFTIVLTPDTRLLRQFPSVAIDPLDVLVRLRRIRAFQSGRIPFEFFPDTVSHIAQMIGLGQQSGVLEVARRRFARLAGVQPLGMMADGVLNERLWTLEILELGFGQQNVLRIIRQQHSLIANEQHSGIPRGDLAFLPD
jgi:hypothetical protein